jgi:hypothetical protein
MSMAFAHTIDNIRYTFASLRRHSNSLPDGKEP